MKSQPILRIYSILLLAVGISLLFLGDDITNMFNMVSSPIITMLLASLYFGFGLVNWHSKNLTIGGIYGRPLLIGNLGHCLIASISIIKLLLSAANMLLVVLAVVYSIFTVLFTYLMYTHPKSE